MKICIVTLYKTINSGSYLQAYALKNYFDSIGYESYVLKYNYSFSWRIKDVFKYPKNFIFENYKNYKIFYNTNRRFKKLQKQLNLISFKESLKVIDLFVFGSDTIWNINSRNIFKLRNILFGISFKHQKKISYAASFANTKYENVVLNKDIVSSLNDFDAISVRDKESSIIIEKICNVMPKIVCDPTLLVEKKIYKLLMNDDIISENYIFVYAFKDFSEYMKSIIIEFATEKRLKIISGTKSFKWCDDRVSNSPDSFLSYISRAKFVITDTFHGAIFSSIFNRQFIVINRDKKKVNDYIKKVGLNDVLLNDDSSINVLFSKKINYEKVNLLIEKYRQESYSFIEESLKMERNV